MAGHDFRWDPSVPSGEELEWKCLHCGAKFKLPKYWYDRGTRQLRVPTKDEMLKVGICNPK